MPQVHAEARAEIDAAVSWYEERVPNLTQKLVTEVEAAFERIDAFPRLGARWEHPGLTAEVRRTRLRTFPYRIVYVLAPDTYVIAFAHDARDPTYLIERLKDV
jgi:toxin ParE1/3/4